MSDIINIIKILHKDYRIAHRDIKPSNILYKNGIWKIADLGIAKFIENKHTLTNNHTLKGTLNFIAPE